MPRQSKWSILLYVIVFASILVSTACGSATPAPATATAPAPATQAVVAVTATLPLPPTATEAPTATPVPPTSTATTEPTATETPVPALSLAQDGIAGWCLPEHTLVSAASDPLKPPSSAQMGQIVDGMLTIKNMPWSACVFNYTFNQAAPDGLKLEVYELKAGKPWLTTALKPVEGKPETVSALLRHTYIINPRLWQITYEFVVKDASGKELSRSKVDLHRYPGGICWQGNLPDPYTLYCPLQQDLHPWDIGYGKKLPTITPRP